MKYSIINSSGVVTGSGSTDASGGGAGKSVLGPFICWSTNSDYPTSYTNLYLPIVGYNSTNANTMQAGVAMSSAGYVNAIQGLINGTTGSTSVSMQLYKNGVAQGLICSGSQPTNGGPPVPIKQAGGSTYSFVVGDVLSVWTVASASNLNQSCNAYLELVLS